jgi:tetratricopeptide (TPR) repeat protein
MDLLNFDGEAMYFDEPVAAQVEALLVEAAEGYGEAQAEHKLLRAYFLDPEHLTVLVALYRYFYYRHRYADALTVAERAIALTARRLKLPVDWRALTHEALGHAVMVSMSLTRFLLLALKGAGYLCLRLGDAKGALARLEKVLEMDTSDRLGVTDLVGLARARLAEERASLAGGKVHYLAT